MSFSAYSFLQSLAIAGMCVGSGVKKDGGESTGGEKEQRKRQEEFVESVSMFFCSFSIYFILF